MSEYDSESDFDSDLELQNVQLLAEALNCDEFASSKGSDSPRHSDDYPEDEDRFSEYAKIELSLALNLQLDERLQRLERVLENRLAECREKLSKVRGQQHPDVDRRESFRYINCGRPYFKDKDSFAAPDNEDTLLMAQNHMYDFSQITSVPGWTMRDKAQLWDQIEKMTKDMKKKELNSKIAALRRDSKKKKPEEKEVIETKIQIIQKEISKISKQTLETLALPINEEYDWEQVTHSLDRRHSAVEYQSLWKLYLHPSINKTNWERHEHQLLQKISYERELRGWEEIAELMNNGRTGYQCFVYFRTNMNNTFTGKKWTQEEVTYLLRLIEYYKEDDYIPWVKVAALMDNRTKIQIYNKYSRLLEQRKGRFLPEEDAVILTCYDKYGANYRLMTKFLPGRSVSQIRVRFQSLNKKRVSTVWTVQEDRKLLQLLINEDTTTNYASITKYFPGKDRINIRARYVTLVKWMRRNPNADISKAPRRGARRLCHGKASDNLNVALEDLKTRIQSEANAKKNNRINKDSSEDAIEDGIIALLVNESIKNTSNSMSEGHDTDKSILANEEFNPNQSVGEGNLHRILIMLRAKLKKDLFESSRNSKICPTVQKTLDQSNVLKIRSYSKKDKIKNIEMNGTPDIWGNSNFKPLEYVLPPNYATITGCRKLMAHVASVDPDDEPVKVCMLFNKNLFLREQYNLLMERFNTLFLWPLILSNEAPDMTIITRTDPPLLTPTHLCNNFNYPVSNNIEIGNIHPYTSKKDCKDCKKIVKGIANTSIDLPAEPVKSDTIIKIDMSHLPCI